MQLTDLKPGDQVILIDYGQTNSSYRRKLLSLGLTRGTSVKVLRIAPLGCPILVEVRGTALSLRKDEARDLIWESC